MGVVASVAVVFGGDLEVAGLPLEIGEVEGIEESASV